MKVGISRFVALRHWWYRCALLAVSVAALACSGGTVPSTTAPPASDGKPLYGGILTLVGADFPLDPHSSNTSSTINVTSQAYNWMLRPAPGDYSMNRLIGDLAETWESSADGKAWTFRLRKGVKWHDGTDFTAEDVRASFDRVLNPAPGFVSPRRGQFSPIQRMETPDPNTIVFHIDRTWAEILNAMSDAQHPILPAQIIKSNPKFFQDNMMGTGPFKLKNFKLKEGAELVRNENYWDKGKPYLDGVTFIYIADVSQAFAAFRTGQLNLYSNISLGQSPSLETPENKDKFIIDPHPVSTQGYINFGLQRPNPFNDLRVRRAANLSIDRDSIAQRTAVECMDAGSSMMMQNTPWYWADVSTMEFKQGTLEQRRAKAKALLAEAGYPSGFAVDLKSRDIPAYSEKAVWVIDQLKSVGINATLKLSDTGGYYEYLEKGNYDVSFDLFASTFATPDDLLNKYFAPEGGQNYNKYNNPRITQLLRQQAQTVDQPQRIKLVNEVEKLLWEDLPMAHVCWQLQPYAMPSYVRDFRKPVSHYNSAYYSDMWFDERYTGLRLSR